MEKISYLEERVSITQVNKTTYKIVITYRNNKYSVLSHNSNAYNRIAKSAFFHRKETIYGYTYQQALNAFYEECKQANLLR